MWNPDNLKWVALATLCLQNTALILSMRYSRSVLKDQYLDATIVISMEFVKFVVSTLLVMRDGGSIGHLFGLLKGSLKIAIPSALYVAQNTCQLQAVNNLDASTFSVLSQAKVLTTAICSIIVLGTTLSARKWRALTLLVLGCILVQYSPPSCDLTMTEEKEAKAASTAWGLLMTAIMVTISGIAGVMIEKILKNKGAGVAQLSIWERNVQLSFWGIIFATGGMIYQNGEQVMEKGFTYGWSGFAIIVILCQSLGGLVTAVVVKYTNTIIKGFVVGLSVVITSIVSWWVFETKLSLIFCVGAGTVLLSVFNYGEEDAVVVPVPSAEAKKIALVPGTPFQPEEQRGLLARTADDDLELQRVGSPSGIVAGRPGSGLGSTRDTAL